MSAVEKDLTRSTAVGLAAAPALQAGAATLAGLLLLIGLAGVALIGLKSVL